MENKLHTRKKENIIEIIFFLLGMVSILFVLCISFYLIYSGIPAIEKIGLKNFLFNQTWASTASQPSYGILPFILTSLYGSIFAIAIGGPIGFFTALYLSKIAKGKLKTFLVSFIDLLAGIPSVIYGLVGMLALVPFVAKTFHLADGASFFSAIIVLSIMVLPSIIKVSMTSLDAVPIEFEQASLALGASELETYFKVSVPCARSGITASIVLGAGRAIGEAMAVMMVAGNVANMPSIFGSVRFLTTAITSEMSYAQGLQQQALFSIALVLFLFIMMINASFHYFSKKHL